MAGYAVKARVNKKYRQRSGIVIMIVAVLSCVGLGLCIYNFIRANYLFAIGYLCAIILGFTYVFIRYNAVFATYAATDKQSVYMRNWTNGFFPYDVENKIRILSEFIPSKTVLVEVPVREIEAVGIGTKNFIKRNLPPNEKFLTGLDETEALAGRSAAKKMLSTELLYVSTRKGGCAFMPIVNFTKRDVIKLIGIIQRQNPDAQVVIGSKSYKSYMAKKR